MSSPFYRFGFCIFALAQETQTQPTRATDYVLGYCAGSSENSIQLHTLLGDEQGHRYPFDLTGIPVASGVTVDLNGAFVVDGEVISADFWPWEFDVDVKFSISMSCESIKVHAESPCLTGSVDIIPIKIPLIPEVLTLDCSPKLFLDATASAEVDFTMSCTLGGARFGSTATSTPASSPSLTPTCRSSPPNSRRKSTAACPWAAICR